MSEYGPATPWDWSQLTDDPLEQFLLFEAVMAHYETDRRHAGEHAEAKRAARDLAEAQLRGE